MSSGTPTAFCWGSKLRFRVPVQHTSTIIFFHNVPIICINWCWIFASPCKWMAALTFVFEICLNVWWRSAKEKKKSTRLIRVRDKGRLTISYWMLQRCTINLKRTWLNLPKLSSSCPGPCFKKRGIKRQLGNGWVQMRGAPHCERHPVHSIKKKGLI